MSKSQNMLTSQLIWEQSQEPEGWLVMLNLFRHDLYLEALESWFVS